MKDTLNILLMGAFAAVGWIKWLRAADEAQMWKARFRMMYEDKHGRFR